MMISSNVPVADAFLSDGFVIKKMTAVMALTRIRNYAVSLLQLHEIFIRKREALIGTNLLKYLNITHLNFAILENNVCSAEEYHCGDGACIPMAWVCDQNEDCTDKSDESSCSKFMFIYILVIICVGLFDNFDFFLLNKHLSRFFLYKVARITFK